ncbi:DNA polymerase I [Varibaculum cambriense]|uniref:DNA polymerase I n=1 Tax=Varibaculum cambriense TaxID=184870 RepID=A0AAJ1BCI1_9ACTO|nr:DNA polymerase I [Varibaculum cambriense]
MADKKTLLVVDGHSAAFRAFYALDPANFRTQEGQYTNAVFGFLRMLVKMLQDEQPDYLAVAFDVSRHSFRTDQYPEYKAGRKPTPPEFAGQVDLIKEALAHLGVTTLEQENIEADDILATLASRGSAAGIRVLVASGDRDTFQLSNEQVTVLYPSRSITDLKRMTPQAIAEKYGVPPHRYPEIAALVGEKADNLPGVPGVGEKTAASWINKYDGLAGVIAHAADIGGKRGEDLRAHLEDVKRNRKLNALLTDLDLGVEVSELTFGKADAAKLEKLLDKLEIGEGTRQALASIPAFALGEKLAEKRPEVELIAPDKVAGWITELTGSVGVVVEGVTTPGSGEATQVTLASKNEAASISLIEGHVETVAALRQWLQNPQGSVFHNWKSAWHALKGAGIALGLPSWDTEIAGYLLDPSARSYDIEVLSGKLLGRALVVEEKEASGQTALDFSGVSNTKTAQIAAALPEISSAEQGRLATGGAEHLWLEMERPVAKILAQMEDTGIAVSDQVLGDLEADLRRQTEDAKQAARSEVDRPELNLSSPKQLQEVLFDQLGMPKTKKTRTGYTTNADALEWLFSKTQHPFLQYLLAHRDSIKLLQTVEGLQKAVHDDGRIHTTFKQTVTATGRLSSADPNLQNIPVRSETGQRIREAFVCGSGFENLMSVDYSQIEMRVMAHMSGDQDLIAAINTGEDLHRTMAAMIFGIPSEQVDDQMRSKVKATSYGLAYGLSAYGLANQLRIGQKEAEKLMERYFARFGKVRSYLRQIVEEARKRGYTETMQGRRRQLPDLRSSNHTLRRMAERAALNAPIQGTAADLMKQAMIRVDQELKAQKLSSRVLLQIHDELILEVAPGEETELRALVEEAMGHAAELSVPLVVGIGVGKNWRSAAH